MWLPIVWPSAAARRARARYRVTFGLRQKKDAWTCRSWKIFTIFLQAAQSPQSSNVSATPGPGLPVVAHDEFL